MGDFLDLYQQKTLIYFKIYSSIKLFPVEQLVSFVTLSHLKQLDALVVNYDLI